MHEAAGNGTAERHHRTVKVMSARKGLLTTLTLTLTYDSEGESVHHYNMTPRDGQRAESAPAAVLFQRVGRDLPVCAVESQPAVVPPAERREQNGDGFRVGDLVWVRRRGPQTRCTDVSRPGTVTRVVSEQLVEVDGVPWHVRCLRRRRRGPDQAPRDSAGGDGDDGPAPLLANPQSDEEWYDAQDEDYELAGSPPVELSEPAPDAALVQPASNEPPERLGMRGRQPPDPYGTVIPNDCR